MISPLISPQPTVRVRSERAAAGVLIVWSMAAAPALGWTALGHRTLSAAAIEILDESVVVLPTEARRMLVDASVQPDLMRPRELVQLRDREAAEHYIDLELLQGHALPDTRSGYLQLVARLSEGPDGLIDRDWTLQTVGTLPYAVVETTQRLAVAFAQLRHRPADPVLLSMAMHHAGYMAHYAQDLCQPLHTSVHHDGRARSDGSSPRTGIHRRLDGLFHWVPLAESVLGGRRSGRFDELFPAVVAELGTSRARVERVYELAADLRVMDQGGEISPELEKFARERFRQAVSFTADLIHTAWLLSASIEIQAPGLAPSTY